MLPNRPGTLTGADNQNLTDVVNAINALGVKLDSLATLTTSNQAQLASLLSSMGQPADTDCETNLLEAQCGILTILGGKAGSNTVSPPICPAFVGGLTYGPLLFTVPTYDGNPVPSAYASADTAPPPFPFIGEAIRWQDNPLASYINVFYHTGPELSELSVCISGRANGAGGALALYRWIPETYAYVQEQLMYNAGYSGDVSYTFPMIAGVRYVFIESFIVDGTPQAQAWVSINPEG